MEIRPLVLVILDGWGLSPEVSGNAIYSTPTPNFDKLMSLFPITSLHASGEEVGLAWGEMGNSEVGHLNLGTGRVVMQDLPRIDKTIADGTFFKNQELLDAFKFAQANGSNLHLLGLFSAGGVHSHINHLFALLDMAKKQEFSRVFIHLITDGRDTPPQTVLKDLPKLEEKMKSLKIGTIASVMGRYYGMDRDKRWERTEKAFNVLTQANAPKANSALEAINAAYAASKSDEFIEPVAIANTPRIAPKDAVIFYNFRSDRARQISDKIIDKGGVYFVSFTSYGHEPSPLVKVAFFAEKVTNQLVMLLANNKITQLHIAETEKYPHVTYFFNGGWEEPFAGEERILVPSPKVATYDLRPEMSAKEVMTKFVENFQNKKPQFTVLNFANSDMVGHTGNFEKTCSAVSTVDAALGQISAAVLNSGADLIVTADHGNAEQMVNPQTGEIDKEHTTNPVPLILALNEKVSKNPQAVSVETKIALAASPPTGVLADITTTIVQRMGLGKPQEMTGQSLEGVL
ncbi:phosphoglycerate mutase (2,3-diphosphoglycerate-independent) [Candidatus Berkelbacteria bacterium RBG_13_40_8]|uniref:2,3-bisphosphoglycerate-independent phosphoglycerate mutase n=1 Tax=Candidatus Berkelbacteria bacterium RBG_13_40_8 TaxID=1797467 RepID=A0A1F5DQ98_9BACT|nr:MAG: phosphoglycerate mutase (2,3-diphosphoglycerate-independent) [Candidatus Berkelbacteria bacterium RBG_13_40_8]